MIAKFIDGICRGKFLTMIGHDKNTAPKIIYYPVGSSNRYQLVFLREDKAYYRQK